MTVEATKGRWRPGVIFDNPIIWREAVPKRLRRAGPVAWLALGAGSVLLSLFAGVYLVGALSLVTPGFQDLASLIAGMWAGVTVLVATSQSARMIAQERAQGTWDALVLTRLGARGIIWGKFLATLLPLWLLGLVIVPMLAAILAATPARQLELGALAWAFAAATIGAASFSGLALYFSMRCATVGSAQTLTFLVIFLQFVVAGAVPELVDNACRSSSSPLNDEAGDLIVAIVPVAVLLLPGFLALFDLLWRFDKIDKAQRG